MSGWDKEWELGGPFSKGQLILCSRQRFHIGSRVGLSYSTSPDCLINNGSWHVLWFEILCLVCLLQCQDEIKKESWVVLTRKDKRPSAPGRGLILEVEWGCLILLLLIAWLIMAVDILFGLVNCVQFVWPNVMVSPFWKGWNNYQKGFRVVFFSLPRIYFHNYHITIFQHTVQPSERISCY